LLFFSLIPSPPSDHQDYTAPRTCKAAGRFFSEPAGLLQPFVSAESLCGLALGSHRCFRGRTRPSPSLFHSLVIQPIRIPLDEVAREPTPGSCAGVRFLSGNCPPFFTFPFFYQWHVGFVTFFAMPTIISFPRPSLASTRFFFFFFFF